MFFNYWDAGCGGQLYFDIVQGFVNALVSLLDTPTQILILDEPFIGLDPRDARYNAEIAQQSLIVLSSHNLDDIEQIASRLFLSKMGN